MDLTHSFTVPTSIEETWESFGDVAGLAECFPGAQVTSAEGDSFEGTVKVKLGPIALVYAGSGTFTEKDEAAHRLVVEAKGRDKRGNGTAGATATITMAAAEAGTSVEVVTDLSITGKPAQFGRGVMQDVSDKLLGQFVACLEKKSAVEEPAADESAAEAPAASSESSSESSDAPSDAPAESAAATAAAEGPADNPPPSASETPVTAEPAAAQPKPTQPKPTQPRSTQAGASNDDALDLGATVLPVLVKSYGKQAAVVLGGLLALLVVLRLVRRR
ncbi:MAG: SRPBCC family protein [Nocardioides sp.]|uniref:SRPBCC family protein n=1 Tax=Nocardioides sp. TaxID=35761 RepID=UPI0039E4CD4D